MKANAGEVYTVYNQYLKRYTACQVAYIAPPDTVSKEPWAVILSLDWVGDAPLTEEELPQLRPLYKDFMYWSRDLHLLRVPLEVPPQYKLAGTLPPFTDQPAAPTAAGVTATMCISRSGGRLSRRNGGGPSRRPWRVKRKRRSAVSR